MNIQYGFINLSFISEPIKMFKYRIILVVNQHTFELIGGGHSNNIPNDFFIKNDEYIYKSLHTQSNTEKKYIWQKERHTFFGFWQTI